MTRDASLSGGIGVLAPIELAEFSEYLSAGVLDNFAHRIIGATPVNLLCKELLRRGKRLAIFSLHPAVTSEHLFEGDNLRIYLGPLATSSVMDSFRNERRFLVERIAREKLACLHAHWTYEYALAASDTGLPFVVTAHDAPINWARRNLIFNPYGRYVRQGDCRIARNNAFWIARTVVAYKALRKAQRVVAVSPYVVDHLHRYRFTRKEIEVIPNGVPNAYFDRHIGFRGDNDSRQNSITFATLLSSWSKLKNGASAIQAFASVRRGLPNATMIMYGPGYSADGPAAAWTRQKGLEDGIEFRGHVPNREIIEALSSRIDVLVHPSLDEAHPMPLIEAMSMGIPVIGGGRSGGVPWTLGDGGLLVDVRSPDAIASAMRLLATDNGRRTHFAQMAHQGVKQRFHLEHVADRYEEIYSSLARR